VTVDLNLNAHVAYTDGETHTIRGIKDYAVDDHFIRLTMQGETWIWLAIPAVKSFKIGPAHLVVPAPSA